MTPIRTAIRGVGELPGPLPESSLANEQLLSRAWLLDTINTQVRVTTTLKWPYTVKRLKEALPDFAK